MLNIVLLATSGDSKPEDVVIVGKAEIGELPVAFDVLSKLEEPELEPRRMAYVVV